MDSDPPPRSPQPSPGLGRSAALFPGPLGPEPGAGPPLQDPCPGPVAVTPGSLPLDLPQDLGELPLPALDEVPSSPAPGLGDGGPGLGLAAPLIGSLIGLLTLVVPLFAVLDDRPGHPLRQVATPSLPSLGSGSGSAFAAPGAP